MSVTYLREAIARGDRAALMRFVYLHLGDGDEAVGRREVEKSWVEALKILLESRIGDREFVVETLKTRDAATLAHLFFDLHFLLVERSGEWIHDETL